MSLVCLSAPPPKTHLKTSGSLWYTGAFTLYHFFPTDGGSHAAKYFPQKYGRVEAKQLNQNSLEKEGGNTCQIKAPEADKKTFASALAILGK